MVLLSRTVNDTPSRNKPDPRRVADGRHRYVRFLGEPSGVVYSRIGVSRPKRCWASAVR